VVAVIVLLAQGALAAGDLLPLLISLSNSYGLLLVCIMMGYGLYTIPLSVSCSALEASALDSIPAQFWRSADSAAELDRAAICAVGLDGIAFDAKHDCLDVIKHLRSLEQQSHEFM
jgi:hypothetical protein